MIEFIITQLTEPGVVGLGIRWRKVTKLLYHSAVRIKTEGTPEELVASLRELADKVEKEINA